MDSVPDLATVIRHTLQGYDAALICHNGHIINTLVSKYPGSNQKFCHTCGSPTTFHCSDCRRPIKGVLMSDQAWMVSDGPYIRPSYCPGCGKAYPWIEAKLQAARELAAEIEGLSADERELLSKSLDDLIQVTPRTELAATRFKKLAAKAPGNVGEVLKGIVTDVASEAIKKILLGPG